MTVTAIGILLNLGIGQGTCTPDGCGTCRLGDIGTCIGEDIAAQP